MKHFDNATYELYSKTVNKQDAATENKKIDNQFNNALKGLVRECIVFTKIVQDEKDRNIDFGSYLRF